MSLLFDTLKSKQLTYSKKGDQLRVSGAGWVSLNLIKANQVFTTEEIIEITTQDRLTSAALEKEMHKALYKLVPSKNIILPNDIQKIVLQYDFYTNVSSLNEDEDLLLINKTTRRMANGVNWGPLSRKLQSVHKDLVKQIKAEAPPLRAIFDPHEPTGLLDSKDEDVISLYNLYETPDWELLDPTAPPHPLVLSFYEHLIPDPDQRKIFFTEIFYLLSDRLQVAQLLYSKTKGTGKNTYVNHMSNLVGTKNYFPLESGFLKNSFTGEISKKRLLFIDEARLMREDEKDKFKSLLNNEITTHSKFSTPTKERNFASFIMATNQNYTVWVEPNDRRFSIFDVTETKLAQKLEKNEINLLINKLFTDPQEQRNFFEYITEMADTKNYSNIDCFLQSKKAWEIIRQTARDPYKYILDEMEIKTKLTYTEAKKGFQNKFQERGSRFPLIGDLKTFFDEYAPYPNFKPVIEIDLDFKLIKSTVIPNTTKKKSTLNEELT